MRSRAWGMIVGTIAGLASCSTGDGAGAGGGGSTAAMSTGASSTGAGACGGHAFAIPACNDCLAKDCCSEQMACAAGTACDGVFTCLDACAPGDAACAQACGMDPAHDALVACLQASCETACVPTQSAVCDSGFAVNTPNDPCASCLGDSCCAEYTACYVNTVCHDCAVSSGQGADCTGSLALSAVKACREQKCSAHCK